LNNMPGDYRKYVLSAISHRAGRKQNLDMLRSFIVKLGSRASTNLFCRIAASWRVNSKEAFELLLAHGARINGNSYNRPIHFAIRANNIDALKALLALHADPLRAEQGDVKQSGFHLAARLGRPQALRCLLEHVLAHTSRNDDGVLVCPFVPLPRDSKGRTPMEVCHTALTKHRNSMSCGQPSLCMRCAQRQSCCKGLHSFCETLQGVLNGLQRVSPQAPFANDTESEASSSADDGDHFFDESDMESQEDVAQQHVPPYPVRNGSFAANSSSASGDPAPSLFSRNGPDTHVIDGQRQHREGVLAYLNRGICTLASVFRRSST